jgi:hypothetical protein
MNYKIEDTGDFEGYHGGSIKVRKGSSGAG